MKANHPRRSLVPLGSLLLLAACQAPRIVPAPTPAPTQAPRPAPPRPAAPPPANWQDAPQTPGDWRWTNEGGRSTARFGTGAEEGELSFACDRAAGTVRLARRGSAGAEVTLTISTTSGTRAAVGTPSGGAIVASFSAGDRFLDAMAFSRGRFAVQAPGLPTLYLPSWPEISRVLEDCR